ncbi:hypothetical protein DIPPA_02306 [Diplonema papillatum]|nr:hypothetical protein DIPPA_02306 [Diplonema papillatum]
MMNSPTTPESPHVDSKKKGKKKKPKKPTASEPSIASPQSGPASLAAMISDEMLEATSSTASQDLLLAERRKARKASEEIQELRRDLERKKVGLRWAFNESENDNRAKLMAIENAERIEKMARWRLLSAELQTAQAVDARRISETKYEQAKEQANQASATVQTLEQELARFRTERGESHRTKTALTSETRSLQSENQHLLAQLADSAGRTAELEQAVQVLEKKLRFEKDERKGIEARYQLAVEQQGLLEKTEAGLRSSLIDTERTHHSEITALRTGIRRLEAEVQRLTREEQEFGEKLMLSESAFREMTAVEEAGCRADWCSKLSSTCAREAVRATSRRWVMERACFLANEGETRQQVASLESQDRGQLFASFVLSHSYSSEVSFTAMTNRTALENLNRNTAVAVLRLEAESTLTELTDALTAKNEALLQINRLLSTLHESQDQLAAALARAEGCDKVKAENAQLKKKLISRSKSCEQSRMQLDALRDKILAPQDERDATLKREAREVALEIGHLRKQLGESQGAGVEDREAFRKTKTALEKKTVEYEALVSRTRILSREVAHLRKENEGLKTEVSRWRPAGDQRSIGAGARSLASVSGGPGDGDYPFEQSLDYSSHGQLPFITSLGQSANFQRPPTPGTIPPPSENPSRRTSLEPIGTLRSRSTSQGQNRRSRPRSVSGRASTGAAAGAAGSDAAGANARVFHLRSTLADKEITLKRVQRELNASEKRSKSLAKRVETLESRLLDANEARKRHEANVISAVSGGDRTVGAKRGSIDSHTTTATTAVGSSHTRQHTVPRGSSALNSTPSLRPVSPSLSPSHTPIQRAISPPRKPPPSRPQSTPTRSPQHSPADSPRRLQTRRKSKDDHLTAIIQDLESEKLSIINQLEEARADVDHLQGEVDNLRHAFEAAEEEKCNERDVWEHQREQLVNLIAEKNDAIEQLEADDDALRSEIEDKMEETQVELAVKEELRVQLETERGDWQDERAMLVAKIEELVDEIENVKTESRDLAMERDLLQADGRAAQDRSEEVAAEIAAIVAERALEKERNRDTVSELKARVEYYEQTNKRLTNELARQTDALESSLHAAKVCETENFTLKSQLDDRVVHPESHQVPAALPPSPSASATAYAGHIRKDISPARHPPSPTTNAATIPAAATTPAALSPSQHQPRPSSPSPSHQLANNLYKSILTQPRHPSHKQQPAANHAHFAPPHELPPPAFSTLQTQYDHANVRLEELASENETLKEQLHATRHRLNGLIQKNNQAALSGNQRAQQRSKSKQNSKGSEGPLADQSLVPASGGQVVEGDADAYQRGYHDGLVEGSKEAHAKFEKKVKDKNVAVQRERITSRRVLSEQALMREELVQAQEELAEARRVHMREVTELRGNAERLTARADSRLIKIKELQSQLRQATPPHHHRDPEPIVTDEPPSNPNAASGGTPSPSITSYSKARKLPVQQRDKA